MNVLLINFMETTYPGGINKTVQEIAKGLVKEGNNVTVLQDNPFNLAKENSYDGYKIIRIKSTLARFFYGFSYEALIFLKNNLEDLKPEIIHVHGYATLFSTAIILFLRKAIKINIPIVFSPHYDINSHDTFAGIHLWDLYSVFGKFIFNCVDKTICASDFERQNVLKRFGIDSSKSIVIPHGVDKFVQKERGFRNQIQLLSAGYILKLKGIQYILEAIHILRIHNNVDVVLTIIGQGPYKRYLIKLSEKLSISDSVVWLPFMPKERLYEEFLKSDVFLLLSISENYGIVVAESLALGTPCIVARTTALTEFTEEPGCFGVDFPPDAQKVAELILGIHRNKFNIGPFSSKIRLWEKVVDDYIATYIELTTNRKT